MRPARTLAPALAALAAAALGAGCGLGPGDPTDGEATLTVTRDYGAQPMVEAVAENPAESETVMRLLDREAEIETRYGGGFVQAIEGVEGGFEGSRSFDWFFYVNGVESEIGAAEYEVSGGDRVWWDHRDWTAAMRVPAVVGSWPEPFLQASVVEDRRPVQVACAAETQRCRTASDALGDAGISSATDELATKAPEGALRLVVGRWDEIRDEPAAKLLERGPEASGVFARFEGDELKLLDERGEEASSGAGLVAATRRGEEPPTWLVTGTDDEGLDEALAILDEKFLRDRYAVATAGGRSIPLPLAGGTP